MTTSTLTLRRYAGPEDLPHLVAVFNAMAEADGLNERRSVDQMAAWYATPTERLDPRRDIVLAEEGGRAIGYGRHNWVDTTDGLREHRVFVFALPDGGAAVDPLLDVLEARAAEAAAEQDAADPAAIGERQRVLGAWIPGNQAWRMAAYERRGYAPVRWDFEMLRPTLDDVEVPPLPDGLGLRPVAGRAQLRRLWDADAEAFRDHWGGFDDSDAAFEEWLSEPELDPTLFVVAWDGDEIAGGVMNTINASENALIGQRRGWLDSVFVRRPWRRHGLAAALVARSLVLLRERGLESAILGVDSENPTGALGVYERAGFRVVSRDANLRRPWPTELSEPHEVSRR